MSLIIVEIGGFNNNIEILKKVCNNRFMKKFVFVLFAFLSVSCFAITKEELLTYPYKHTSFYGGSFSKDLLQKVRPFEGNAATFLKEYDGFDGYKNHALTKEEEAAFVEYFSYLPQTLQNAVRDYVYAIYFVDEMWYGALTDIIFDENGREQCIMFFNADVLYYPLDIWLTYRDNTLFKDTDDNNNVVVECNNNFSAFLHIFIHEAVHVYDFVNNVTPYSYDSTKPADPNNLFFSVWKDKSTPLKKYRNKKFEKTAYYEFGVKLPISQGKNVIEYLSKSPFCTPYAAKNWMDDFAESVTFYYLQRRFGINYKITWYKNGQPKATYSYKDNPNAHVYDELCKEILGF